MLWVFFPWNRLVTGVVPEGRAREMALKAGALFPYQNIGSEFMPPLYEGDLLYMPTTFPGISPTKARQILQITDRIIKSFPEVKTVFGKAGRAETATDPAPMDMIETTIQLKPEAEWPAADIKDDNGRVIAHRRRTHDELTDALNDAVQIPGLNNAWTMPIITRIDMLSTGIKTPIGIKVAGPDLRELERIGTEIEAVMRTVPGTASAYAERVNGGRFIEFEINRDAIARYGLTIGDVQDVLSVALGGMPLTTTVEGLQRYTINLRYDRDFRSDLRSLSDDIVVPTPSGAQVPLGQLATLKVVDGPMGIKSEGAVPNAWIYVDIRGVDVGTYVQMAMHAVNESIAKGAIKLPPGYNIFWSGQYEYMLRAQQRLMIVVPLTLLIIVLIIYLNTRSLVKTAIVMLAVPFSLVGAFWIIYLLHYNLSVAVWVGIIALAGLDAETGVVMLLYLDLAYDEWKNEGADAPRRRFARRHLSRSGQTRPSEGDDRVRHHRRSGADFVEPRHRRGRDETHRHADGGRRRDLDAHGTAGLPGDILPMALAQFQAGRDGKIRWASRAGVSLKVRTCGSHLNPVAASAPAENGKSVSKIVLRNHIEVVANSKWSRVRTRWPCPPKKCLLRDQWCRWTVKKSQRSS